MGKPIFVHIPKTAGCSLYSLIDNHQRWIDECKGIPSYKSFYTEKAKRLVYQIYKTDIERFNYKFPY